MGNKPKGYSTKFIRTLELIELNDREFSLRDCAGQETVIARNQLCKHEEWYYIAAFSRARRMRQSAWFRLINVVVDKHGNVKSRRESQKYTEDMARWNRAVNYNMKAKLLGAGTVDIINDKINYTPGPNTVDAIIPAIVESINNMNFSSPFVMCRDTLESINIQAKFTTIPKNFAAATNIVSVRLPNTVHTINNNAFAYCSRLAEIDIPGSVNKIAPQAFYRATGLKKVKFNGVLKYLGSQAFYYCTSLEEVELPNGLFEIPDSCFAYCQSLRYIYIPKSVRKIHPSAFAYMNKNCVIKAPNHLRPYLTGSGNSHLRVMYY